MENFESVPKIETPDEHTEKIKRMMDGIKKDDRVIIATKDHPNLNHKISIIRSIDFEGPKPGFNADSAPMKNVRYDLEKIVSIEKVEDPQ